MGSSDIEIPLSEIQENTYRLMQTYLFCYQSY